MKALKNFLIKLLGGHKIVYLEVNRELISSRVLSTTPGEKYIFLTKMGQIIVNKDDSITVICEKKYFK